MGQASRAANANVKEAETHSDEALQRSGRRYRALIEATSQAVWSWIPGTHANDFERSQQWWAELTGQTPEEQNAKPNAWLDVVHADDRAAAADAWTTSIASGTTYDTVYRVRARAGGWRFVRARGVPIRGADNTVYEWVGTLDDVTTVHEASAEQKRLLALAQAEHRQLEDLFRHAPSFMAVLRGPDHMFERINDRYIELIGGRNVIGLPARQALPEVEGQGYFELLDQVYRTGQPHVSADARMRLHNPSGPTERVRQFVYQPMFNVDGLVAGVIVQGIDLTEHRQTEDQLSRLSVESDRQRRLYETALSNTADFVYLFDTNGRFTYVNKALLDLWGKDLSEAVGRNFSDLEYPPELAARLQTQISEVVQTGCSQRDQALYTSAQGTRAYEHIFMPVFGLDGKVEAVAGSTRDITDRMEMEKVLRESEQRHRALVTATSDVVYRMSADWATMLPLDGRDLVSSNAEPIDRWMEKNLPAFEHARVQKTIDQAITNKSIFEFEHQVIGVDGSLGWTFSRAVPLLDSAGEIIEWFGAASDITRRKRVEEELRDIRSRMEAALDAAAIGTWSWDVQADRFYGDASLARIFGRDPEHTDGVPLTGMVDAIHPEDRERVQKLVMAALDTGERYEADYRVAQPDGSWKWITARGQIECDETGRAVRFPGVVIDITDWKRTQEDLERLTDESQRRKRLYETILSNTPDLAYVFDLDHRFVYANEILLKMWGKTWDEAIGKTCLELGYETWHASMHDREIEQVKATRSSVRGEVPFHGTFGRRIYDYIFVPVLGMNGEVEAIAGTTRDVTERKEAEEALKEADRKKDDFIALLAHELRNPLAPIRNGLQVLRLAQANPSILDEARDMMERQLFHMVRLIDDLLDISRITRNKMELRRERVTLAEVISHAVETAQPAIQSADHELIVLMPSESIVVDADLTRLSQVFSNLLNNSAKYTGRGGRIWLSSEVADNEAVISVRDTGIGIPASALPKIFDMFSQVDRSVEKSTGGLGIGLALVKGLVEMHGGSVTAESVEGNGSTFTVRLPIAEPQKDAHQRTEDAHLPGRARRVLVVDDNKDSAESMAMMLRMLGHEVTTAHDGLEAVAAAGAFRPEIILMDIGLPRLNGLDATRRIREQSWGQSPKIIALTGWGQESDREQSRAAGCDGHLVKPVNLADLESLLV